MTLYQLLMQLHQVIAADPANGSLPVHIDSSYGEYSPDDIETVTVTGDGTDMYVLLTSDDGEPDDAPSYDDLSAVGYMDGIDYADPTANG